MAQEEKSIRTKITMMINNLNNNDIFNRVESLDINGVSTFTIRQPTIHDLDSIESFIKYIDSVKYEHKEYRKSLRNTFYDKFDIEDTLNEISLNIMHRAKDIKRKANVKVFWINNNVYVLEKKIGKNIVNALYCNDKGQYKGKIHIPNDTLSLFLYFMNEDLKLGNTKFEISFKKQLNEWNDMFKHNFIIKQHDKNCVRVVSGSLLGNSFMNDFKRIS